MPVTFNFHAPVHHVAETINIVNHYHTPVAPTDAPSLMLPMSEAEPMEPEQAITAPPPRQQGGQQPSFRHIIAHHQPEALLERLHQLIDGRRGADVGSVLLKCLLDGYIGRRPTQREFEEEFQLIGGWRAIHKYMDDNNENALIRSNKVIIF